MQDDIVRSEKDERGYQREYRLGAYLHSGLIGAVYPGLAMDGSGEKVAVKLPAHNLNDEERERFMREYEVLQKIVSKIPASSLPVPVPRMKRGINLSAREEGRKPALIMEFVGEDLLLSRQLPAADTHPWQREVMLLQAGRQYARLLVGLHEAGYTCQDRKLTDLRWTPEDGGRLIVLDWNVVGEIQLGSKPLEDIRLFGRLWYQLLSGRYAPTNLDPLDDTLWREGAVSYGTRRLIVDALTGKYREAIKLEAALDEQWRLLERPVTELVVEAQRGYEELKRTWRDEQASPRRPEEWRLLDLFDLAKEWRILDLFDLAVRRGSEDVVQERQDVLAHVQDQGERLIANLKQAILIGEYKLGGPAGDQAQAIATQQTDPQLQLRVARWQLLIAAGEQSIREHTQLMSSGLRDRRPIFKFLVKWIEDVEGNVVQRAGPQWWERQAVQLEPRLKQYFPADSHTLALLQNLIQEARLWAAVVGVEQAQEQGDYKLAQEHVEQVAPLLQSIADVGYHARVQAALPEDPDRWQNTLEERAREQLILDSWNRDVQRFLAHLDRRNREIDGSPEGGEWLGQLRQLEDAALIAETHPGEEKPWLEVVRLALSLHYAPQLRGRLAEGPLYQRLRERVKEHLDRVREVVEKRQSKDVGFAYQLATEAWKLEREMIDGREKSIMGNVVIENTLFDDLANRMSQLRVQSKVREEILAAMEAGNWQVAMQLAKENGIDLFLDTQFEQKTAKYWKQVTEQTEQLHEQAAKALEQAQAAISRLKEQEIWMAFARADQAILDRNVEALEQRVKEIQPQIGAGGTLATRLNELQDELKWLRDLEGKPDEDLLAHSRNSRFKALKANTGRGGFAHQDEVATLMRHLAESLKSGAMERFEEEVQKFQSFLARPNVGEMERILYSDLLSAWQMRADRRQLLLDEIVAVQQFLKPLDQIKQQNRRDQLIYLQDMFVRQNQLLQQFTEAPAELSFCQGKQKPLGKEIQECLDQTVKFMKTLDLHLYGEGGSHGAWFDDYLKGKSDELVSRSRQGERFFQLYGPRTDNQQGQHVPGRSPVQGESQRQSHTQQPQAAIGRPSASTQMRESLTSPFAAPSPQEVSPTISDFWATEQQNELDSSMEATGNVASIHMKTDEPLDVRSGGEKIITIELRDKSSRLVTDSYQVKMALNDPQHGGLLVRGQGPPRYDVTFQVERGRQEVVYRAPYMSPLDGVGGQHTIIIRAKVDDHETELKLALKPGWS